MSIAEEQAAPVDEVRVRALTESLLLSVIPHYKAGPRSPDRIYELLNALAVVTAEIIRGTGGDPLAREFFDAALKMQLRLH